jgi:hypothetical protein
MKVIHIKRLLSTKHEEQDGAAVMVFIIIYFSR